MTQLSSVEIPGILSMNKRHVRAGVCPRWEGTAGAGGLGRVPLGLVGTHAALRDAEGSAL